MPATYRVATFVTYLVQDVLKIYNSLQFPNPESRNDMTTILTLMERHCVDETNVIYNHYVFKRRDQAEHESFETYLTNVRELVSHCTFGPMESELLCDRIVCGICDSCLHKLLLQKETLTLASCIDCVELAK